MHTESPHASRGGPRWRRPFLRRNRHPGLAEHAAPRQPPKPKGEIPESFAGNVFGLVNPLLQHAVAEEEYLTPTPIQEKSIPHLLEGRDLLGCAQTGTGKTAAFLLPILHRLALNPQPAVPNKPRALILAPTRELAAQIATSTDTYGRYLGLPFAVVFGGVSQYPQVSALARGAELVVATPGRLLDLMEQRHVSLERVEEFVLDEADRMLDMGFMPDIKRILSALPQQRHSQFFSATLSPEVMRLAMQMVKDPVHVTISPEKPTVDKINQKVMFVDKPNKDGLLSHLLQNRPEFDKVIVFARTRHGADRIVKKLAQSEIRAEAIHSDKTQRARTDALNAFRSGRVRVLVATDIASRGIDVEGITHVINFDLPVETESYVHRIGRTARAGAAGAAISFVSAEERGLLRAIERIIRKPIEVDADHPLHSERAEKAAGRGAPATLPAPPWAERKQKGREPERRERPVRHRHLGRNQPDFKQREETSAERPERSEQEQRPESAERPQHAERPRQAHAERSGQGGRPERPFRPPRASDDRSGPRGGGERPPWEERGPRPKRPFQRPGDKPHSGQTERPAQTSEGGPKVGPAPKGGFKGGFKGKGGPKRRTNLPPWMR